MSVRIGRMASWRKTRQPTVGPGLVEGDRGQERQILGKSTENLSCPAPLPPFACNALQGLPEVRIEATSGDTADTLITDGMWNIRRALADIRSCLQVSAKFRRSRLLEV